MIHFAAKYPDAIVPAYTVGVQAQPISFGHYIFAYVEALERNAERLRRAYANVNKSPLGAAALGTSSFPVNRASPSCSALTALWKIPWTPIRFRPSYNRVEPGERRERRGVDRRNFYFRSRSAVPHDHAVADARRRRAHRHEQHHAAEGQSHALHNVRVGASEVLGVGTTYFFKAHNVPHGLSDYKGGEPVEALNRMARMLTVSQRW